MGEHKNQVLVVEDGPSVRRTIQRLLKGAGLESRGFESADDFFKLAESSRAACVLIDLNLPGVDGVGIQTWLGNGGHELPTVFMTGKGDVTSTATAMKQSAVDFLAKPVEVMEGFRRRLPGKPRHCGTP